MVQTFEELRHISTEESRRWSRTSGSQSCNSRIDDVENNLMRKLKQIERLNVENEFLQNFYDRKVKFIGQVQLSEYVKAHGKGRSINIRVKNIIPDRYIVLEPSQKCEVLCEELKQLQNEVKSFQLTSERTINELHAMQENFAIEMMELCKSRQRFDRAMSINPKHVKHYLPHPRHKTGTKYTVEQFHQHHEKYARFQDSQISILGLDTHNLHRKLESLKKDVREASDVINRPARIDFEVLQHSNSLAMESLFEHDNQIIELKFKYSQCFTRLCRERKKLNLVLRENAELREKVHVRVNETKKVLMKIQSQTPHFEKEKQDGAHLTHLITKFNCPSATDYINVLRESDALDLALRTSNRKLYMAKLCDSAKALSQHRRKLSQS